MLTDRLRAYARALGRALLLCAALSVCHCESAREDPTGGETHFLRPCDAGADCGSELACVCGVCTLTCSETTTCEGLPSASCVAPSPSDGCAEPPAGRCDVTCTTDSDCAALPTVARCVAGACRADGGEPPTTCAASAQEVVVIGDSFFATNRSLTAFLEDLARQNGALAEGARYRDHSSMLGNTLALLGNGIEAQYAAAAAEGAVEVVIMTAGGADVLVGSCELLTVDCPMLSDAADAARALFQRMAADGVERVIYAFYPDPNDAALRAKLGALRPLLESACQQSPVPCQWVDLRPTFSGHEALYLEAEGTIATPEGAHASADAIWEAQSRCLN